MLLTARYGICGLPHIFMLQGKQGDFGVALIRELAEAPWWRAVTPWLSFNEFTMYDLKPQISLFTAVLRTVSATSIKSFDCCLVGCVQCCCFLHCRGRHR